MSTEAPGYGWLSSQIYFAGDLYGDTADRLLFEVVQPVDAECRERRWARRSFFIRYGDIGPHIRFRLYGRREVLERQVRPRLLAQVDGSRLAERLDWRVYEPETWRYGGPCGVALAERFFHGSSEAAYALLRKVDAERRPSRLGKGLLAMLVLLHTFRDSRRAAAELSAAYGSNYLHAMVPDRQERAAHLEIFAHGYDRQAERLAPYVETAWEALAAGEPLTEELDLYRRHLLDVRRRFRRLAAAGRLQTETTTFNGYADSLQHIVPSYIHMMNNRLGITTREETYLALVIHRTLSRLPPPVAGEA